MEHRQLLSYSNGAKLKTQLVKTFNIEQTL